MRFSTPIVALVAAIVGGALSSAGSQVDSDMVAATATKTAPPHLVINDKPRIQLERVAEGLAAPVAVAAPNDGSGRLFVVERHGRIRIVTPEGDLLDTPFLDLGSRIQSSYLEQGLLGLAFHPDYAVNGRLFVAFTDYRTNGDTFIMEFPVSRDDPNKADAKDGRLLLAVDQPFVEHNGGTLRFGPDGYLYIGMGDGGHNGDPYDYAQDRGSLLGKILRIDVDSEGPLPYAIPPDNPFASRGRNDSPFVPTGTPVDGSRRNTGRSLAEPPPPVMSDAGIAAQARPEIWALGLRNPWQFAFDPDTGDLYIPDVGHRAWEELNVELAGSLGGANYGWDWQEGSHCYPDDVTTCPRQQLGILPVAEYGHGEEHCAIVGIGVYRGDDSPTLDGMYFHGDYCSGTIWALERDSGGTWQHHERLDTELRFNGSGQDAAGELYLAADGEQTGAYGDPHANPTGTLWRLTAAGKDSSGGTPAP